MHLKYPTIVIQEIVKVYGKGMSITTLSNNYDVPRSTIYYWINKYTVISHSYKNTTVLENVYLLKKLIIKIQTENQILNECGCYLN